MKVNQLSSIRTQEKFHGQENPFFFLIPRNEFLFCPGKNIAYTISDYDRSRLKIFFFFPSHPPSSSKSPSEKKNDQRIKKDRKHVSSQSSRQTNTNNPVIFQGNPDNRFRLFPHLSRSKSKIITEEKKKENEKKIISGDI